MEVRIHKLLVMVGEEGVDLEERDFKKLSEVIINDCISQSNTHITTLNFLVDFMCKVIQQIPLKQHIYAQLTALISLKNQDISNRIIQKTLNNLQQCLNNGEFYQIRNILQYLAQLMNISLLNSLTFMNILDDILVIAENQSNIKTKQSYLSILIRVLPIYAYSLNDKISHQFKKILQKIQKNIPNDLLLKYIIKLHQRNKLIDLSNIPRLSVQLPQLIQNNLQFQIKLKQSNIIGKQLPEYYSISKDNQDQLYRQFYLTQGQIHKYAIQSLIYTFVSNNQILKLKLINYLTFFKNGFVLKLAVQILICKALKNSSFVEISLIIYLCQLEQTCQCRKFVQDILQTLFLDGQSMQISVILTFTKIYSLIANNWKRQWDWQGILQQEDKFMKRTVIMHIILQKMQLLNDKFQIPAKLNKYEVPKPATNPYQYQNINQMETFQNYTTEIKHKSESAQIIPLITSEQQYEIFLQALFQSTSISQTHLKILMGRYQQILLRHISQDWILINKIRNFWKHSLLHRLIYLRWIISKSLSTYTSYVKYINQLEDKTNLQIIWIKIELNQLNKHFGMKNNH